MQLRDLHRLPVLVLSVVAVSAHAHDSAQPTFADATPSPIATASAQDQGAEARLEPVVVTGTQSLTVPNAEQATSNIQRTPGGVEVIPDTAFKDGPADTIKDVLGSIPGVFTSESRYGADARVSIRGSGLSRPYGNRGINVYTDGIPMNTSDGLIDLFELDPTAYRYVEVFKGANGMRYGANSLGGAINFVSTTGRDASPFEARGDTGSFGYHKEQLSTGGVSGKFDYFITGSEEGFDGFRDHSQGEQKRASANFGFQFSATAETRFYVNLNWLKDHLPGELDKATALNAPTTAGADFVWKDQQRNINSHHIANKTTLRFDDTTVEFGVFTTFRTVDHPNYLYLDYTVHDNGGFLRVSDDRVIGGYRNTLVVGANILDGTLDSQSYAYANTYPFGAYPSGAIPGTVPGAVKGFLVSATYDSPTNRSIYLDDAVFVRPDLALDIGVQFQQAGRDRQDRLNPQHSVNLSYDNATPKVGILWDLSASSQAFANVSRSAEAPTYDVNASYNPNPLRAQTATTYEIGTRGHLPDRDWDLSLYRAEIQNELQCVSTYPGSCNFVNASHTVHQGIEAGGGIVVLESAFSKGDSVRLNAAYTYNDFHFDNDSVYGNNRLAAAPTQLVHAELLFNDPRGFFAGPSVEWMPKSYFADNANTTAVDPYKVWNIRVGYKPLHQGWSAYLEGRNLFDARYISTVDAAGSADASAQIFYPGTGRSLRAGVQFSL